MRKAEWNVSAGLKQLKIAKWKVELKKKKHENVKLKEEDVPGAILLREKLEECIVKKLQLLPWSQNNRKENAVRTKVTARGPGSS